MSEDFDNFDRTLAVFLGLISVFMVGIVGAMIYKIHQQNQIEKTAKVVREEIRSYEIVGINPPKHFSVTLLDVKTHQLFEHESNSKHCDRWREIKFNSIIDIKTTYIKYDGDDTLYIKLADMNNHFCG